jgi:hypothetical protein
MTARPHDHARPGIPEQRAALAVARAVILGADADAHEAATVDGACPACTTIAAISFGFALAATIAGETGLMSQAMRLRLLAAVNATQAELDTGLN